MDEWNYETIHATARDNGCSVEDLYVLSQGNDPFFVGAKAHTRQATWFKEIWDLMECGPGTHLRRIHYQLVSQSEPVAFPWGGVYENTDRCFNGLCVAATQARYLGLVSADDFVDRRAPDPMIFRPDVEEAEISVDDKGEVDLQLRKFPSPPEYSFEPFSAEQRYLLEIWCEKSTMDDVLMPICRDYGCNLITGVGEFSITAVRHLLMDRLGELPARIFYVSDFDPAGESMPVAVARKLEFYLRNEDLDSDIKLFPIVLTEEQVAEYELPRTPLKEGEKRAKNWEKKYQEKAGTELDALEALHPGTLAEIVQEWLDKFYDHDHEEAIDDFNHEIRMDLENRSEEAADAREEELDRLKKAYEEIQKKVGKQLTEIGDEVREIYREIYESLDGDCPSLEDYGLPEPADEQESQTPLYDSSREYLDQLCHYKTFQKKPLPQRRENVCPHCGVTYVVSRTGHDFCSQRCRQAHQRGPAGGTFVCVQCGKEFQGKTKKAMYCSKKCKSYSEYLRRKAAK